MPKIVDREEKRDSLVKAAASVFASQGFSRARIADIAEAADVGKGTIYEYFDSKEELFLAVFEWFNRSIASRIDDRLGRETSGRAQLEAIFEESAAIIADLRDITSLNLDFWSACRGSSFEGRFKEALEGVYSEFRRMVAGIIESGQRLGEFRTDVDPYAIAAALVGAYDGLSVQLWIDESLDLKGSSTAFSRTMMSGLASEPS